VNLKGGEKGKKKFKREKFWAPKKENLKVIFFFPTETSRAPTLGL
jgi:hypothetical protein